LSATFKPGRRLRIGLVRRPCREGVGETTMHMATEKRASVLLVEDEVLICEVTAEALEEQGFEVKAFTNGEEALRHLAANGPVDVLFTDCNLPGIDGQALARRACELRPGLPVMYTSGRKSRIEHLDPVDGSMFVPKPYNPFEIGRLLDYLIALKKRPVARQLQAVSA
jgi:CheY-like chemotaxis protein